MTKASPQVRRARAAKVAGAGTLVGAGLLLSACFGPGIIATQIGTGTAGYTGDGGAATSATVTGPTGITVDASGNAYIGDTGNCVIRKYTASTGKISTIAGTGACGLSGDGGAATSATLNHPAGVTVGPDGNVYVADSDNNRIREITLSTGVISTYAGTSSGAANGDRLTTAKFKHPTGLAFDSSGNLFVADSQNHAVRRVDAGTGVVSTYGGTLGTSGNSGDDGTPATSALLNSPEAITVDAYDEVVVADSGNCEVHTIDTNDDIYLTAGTTCGFSGDGGQAGVAQFGNVKGIGVDSGNNIYVSDTTNNRIRMISAADGTVATVAGTGTAGATGDDGAATSGTLNGPTRLFVVSHDRVWIADTGNNRIRVVGLTPLTTTTVGSTTTTIAGG